MSDSHFSPTFIYLQSIFSATSEFNLKLFSLPPSTCPCLAPSLSPDKLFWWKASKASKYFFIGTFAFYPSNLSLTWLLTPVNHTLKRCCDLTSLLPPALLQTQLQLPWTLGSSQVNLHTWYWVLPLFILPSLTMATMMMATAATLLLIFCLKSFTMS